MWPRIQPYVAALVLQLPWLLVLPLALGLWNVPIPLNLSGSFADALARSLFVALLTSLFCVTSGLLGAWFCRRVATRSARVLMHALLIPVLVGPIAIGFLAKLAVLKLAFVNSAISSRGAIPTLLFALILYGFQYGPLCLYVFWLRARTVPLNLVHYSKSAHLTPGEVAADILWPHSRPLFQVMFVLVFMLTATEFAASELSIRPSVGTETALLSHWLSEQYRIWLPADPRIAASEVAAYGLIAAGIVVLTCFVVSWTLCRMVDAFARSGSWFAGVPSRAANLASLRQPLAEVVGIAAPLVCISPLLFAYVVFPPKPVPNATPLLEALLWSLPATLAMVSVAIGLAIVIRLVIRRGALGPASAHVIYILAMNPLAVPALVVSVAAFRWFTGLDTLSSLTVPAGWVGGHVLLAMPVLGAFAVYLHTQVTDKELEYQRMVALRPRELIRVTFWDRLRTDYLLVLLFGWSLAWNDGIINRAAASDLPSLYSVIAPLLSVRPDYHAAQFCLLLSVAIATLMVVLWHRLTSKLIES